MSYESMICKVIQRLKPIEIALLIEALAGYDATTDKFHPTKRTSARKTLQTLFDIHAVICPSCGPRIVESLEFSISNWSKMERQHRSGGNNRVLDKAKKLSPELFWD